jgi:hypothetical protein
VAVSSASNQIEVARRCWLHRQCGLRKRFYRKFNFELQAAATEDNIVLSLITAQLNEVARYLNSKSVRPLLIQAMLDAPMFTSRLMAFNFAS